MGRDTRTIIGLVFYSISTAVLFVGIKYENCSFPNFHESQFRVFNFIVTKCKAKGGTSKDWQIIVSLSGGFNTHTHLYRWK
ncbi:hypothetical protein XELAEV_18039989mg [Xenopus laevis]|uniref:Uncharacterized protein n=1 Tax=Xenopus laevis TaxID=8355 RepID=A0A974H8W2_XENLA|nr:hypothetical protein XELAEV_18039989mg [Xenopus laevis]